jgi:hypothetical protein
LRLVVMAKRPIAGLVKTRLAREIGTVAATYFYRHAARALLLRLGSDRRWQTLLSIAPDVAVDDRTWPRGLGRMPQGGGDLGRRMQRIMDEAPLGPVLIVGTDIPAIEPRHIAAAFRQLGRYDAVFGPAEDGGYWLVGFRRRPRTPHGFAGVRWSHPETLADSMANLDGLGLGMAARLADVDDRRSWERVRATSGRVVRASAQRPCPRRYEAR